MLKALNINDTLVTPYTATKDWHLSNSEDTDLILFEHTGSDGNPIAVAVEFIDYGDGSGGPFVNNSCSLANEKQSLNKASFREGKKTTGTFFPDEPQNLDGTYKRIVYSQIQGMFYNNYRDPTKMWGMEEIDFDKSQAKKFLTDKFVILDVPTIIMGEKILPNSVEINDTTSDNDYTIIDDGHTNLFIGTSVFSKQQELRSFGNQFISSSDGTCNGYFDFNPPNAPLLNGTTISNGLFGTASLSWTQSGVVNGFSLEKSLNGNTFLTLAMFGNNSFSYNDYPISASTNYYYRVYSFDSRGTSSYSNIVTESFRLLNQFQSAETWVNTGKTLPASICGQGAFVAGDTTYLIGGLLLQNGPSINNIWTSSLGDPSTIRDSELTFPITSSFPIVKRYGNKIFVFNTTGEIYTASVSSPMTWGLAGSLPLYLYSPYIVTIGTKLYLFGGQLNNGIVNTSSYTASMSDPTIWSTAQTITWAVPSYPATAVSSSYQGQCIIVNDTIWIHGGYNNIDTLAESNEVYTASVSNPFSWGLANVNAGSTLVEMPKVVIGNYIYYVCGRTGNSEQSNTYKIPFFNGNNVIGGLLYPFTLTAGAISPGHVKMASVVFSGSIYVYGGGSNIAGSGYPATYNTIYSCSYVDLGPTASVDTSTIAMADEPWHGALNY